MPCPWTTSYKYLKGFHSLLSDPSSPYCIPEAGLQDTLCILRYESLQASRPTWFLQRQKKGAKNSFCDWSRSHVTKQMNVGGQIRLHCSKQWIIKQMLDLFSVLNLILLASSQPLLALKMSPVKRQSLLNGKFHQRQRTCLVTIRIVMLSKQQQPPTKKIKKTPYSILWLHI